MADDSALSALAELSAGIPLLGWRAAALCVFTVLPASNFSLAARALPVTGDVGWAAACAAAVASPC